MNKRLWEIEHPYYCSESNYYAPGNDQPYQSYKSWGEFDQEYRDSDLDMNLVFRWDWREGEGWELPEFNGDVNYRNGKLLIFFMGQRKGLYRWVDIEVCRADEPSVIEFLSVRWDHLKLMWEPFSGEQS
jgi:hypothetical protein